MNRRLTLNAFLAACILLPVSARADLIAYEGFDYGSLPNLGGANGGTGWAGPWMDYSSGLATAAAANGLTWPALPSRPGGAITPPSPHLTEWVDSTSAI